MLEAFVAFEREVSVILARGRDGATRAYDVVENVHKDGILATSTVPATIAPDLADEAVAIAERIAAALGHVGVLAVEMFVIRRRAVRGCWSTKSLRGSTIPVIGPPTRASARSSSSTSAPSPAGRWADTERHSDAVMTNLIGDAAAEWATLAAEPGARLHLYGKAETRPGRKMGHVNRIAPRTRALTVAF